MIRITMIIREAFFKDIGNGLNGAKIAILFSFGDLYVPVDAG